MMADASGRPREFQQAVILMPPDTLMASPMPVAPPVTMAR